MIHIFDVDHTVINKSSTRHFLREALKDGVIRFSMIRRLPVDWIRYKLGRPDMDFIEKAVENLAGIEKSDLERIAAGCFERRMKSDIYNGALELIGEALKRNERVIFATSSFDFSIRPLERFFGIEGSLASEMEFSNGRTTGRLAGSSLFGIKKKIAVEAWLKRNGLSPDEACFYSDSYTDIPLLEYCGRQKAVNPDHVLAREAKKRGWEILRFNNVIGKAVI